jgi:hypothetical protein
MGDIMRKVNIVEVTEQIKAAGSIKVRVVPMPGNNINGKYQIDVLKGIEWSPIIEGLEKTMAESIVQQAFNRVICG